MINVTIQMHIAMIYIILILVQAMFAWKKNSAFGHVLVRDATGISA